MSFCLIWFLLILMQCLTRYFGQPVSFRLQILPSHSVSVSSITMHDQLMVISIVLISHHFDEGDYENDAKGEKDLFHLTLL